MKTQVLLFAFSSLAFVAAAQSICFDPENDNRYATGTGPVAIATADFNDDGFPDVATANRYEGTVSVLFGDNAGGFDQQHIVGTGGVPLNVVAADFNNDMIPDLVTRNNEGTNEISLLINDGTGNFNAAVNFSYGAYANESNEMEAADVNNDGKMDIVINDYTNNQVIILRNNGNSTFTNLDVLSTSQKPDKMALGRLNNDNFPDLVVSYYPTSVSNDSISYFVNNGDGTFGARTTMLVVAAFDVKKKVHIADINNDNLGEIICEGVADLRVFINNPALTFTAQPLLFAGGYAEQIKTGLFNADNMVDILAVDYSGGVAAVLLGNGNGTFQPFNAYSVNGSPFDGVLGDFDNDNQPDLIAANSLGYVSFVKGNVDGSFGSYSLRTLNRPKGFDAGLINNDAFLDLVVANSQSSFISVMKGNGDGTFQNTSNQAISYPADDVALGDFNTDNLLDVVTANSTCEILSNNGAGVFTSGATVTHGINTNGTWFIAAAHLNTDNFLDIVLGVNNLDSVAVMLGNGNMTFQTAVKYAVGSTPNSILAKDLNNDNKIDLLVANDQSNNVSLLINNGNGTFQTAISLPAANGPRGAAAGDFDGNSSVDIAVVNNNSNNITVHLANGTLTYAAGVAYTITNSPNGITSGYVNSDNFLDLLVLHGTAPSIGVFTGNGDGTFNNPVEYTVETGPNEVIAADFNQDGETDIASVNYNTNNVSVILNNGAYITAGGSTQLCDGDSVMLTASGGYSYEWNTGETTASIYVDEDDTYSCTITNQSGTCTLIPPSVPVTVNPSTVMVTFALPNNNPVCETEAPISLQGGSPQGGTYSGTGVVNGIFTPSTAGDGSHPIKYVYIDPAGCARDSAYSTLVVDAFVAASMAGVFSTDTFCTTDAPVTLTGEGTPAGGDWFINGASASSFSPTALGQSSNVVQYVVTSGACVDTASANLAVVTCSGIEERENDSWNLFPNPFENSIRIQHNSADITGLIIIENLTGQEVFRQNFNGTDFAIAPVLASGIYQLRIVQESGNRLFRVVRK